MKSATKNVTRNIIADRRDHRVKVVRMKITIILLMIILCALFLILRVPNASAEENNGRLKCYKSITIKEKDTLWDIAEVYMTDEYDDIRDYIKEVCKINHINANYIKAGESIIVPYYADVDYETENETKK